MNKTYYLKQVWSRTLYQADKEMRDWMSLLDRKIWFSLDILDRMRKYSGYKNNIGQIRKAKDVRKVKCKVWDVDKSLLRIKLVNKTEQF